MFRKLDVASIILSTLILSLSLSGLLLHNSELPTQIIHLETSEPGYFIDNNSTTGQTPCPDGTYQPQSSQLSCISADKGYAVNNTWETAIDVSTSESHTCAINYLESLYCWGTQTDGALGNGIYTHHSGYNEVFDNDITVSSVSTGYRKTCSILSNKSLYCWGNNDNRDISLGSNSPNKILTPSLIRSSSIGENVSAVSVGSGFLCALRDDGVVFCWGSNSEGELGDGTTQSRSYPTKTNLPPGRIAIDLKTNNGYSCAILDNLSQFCWGYIQLQSNSLNAPVGIIEFPNNAQVSSQSLGKSNACAILINGSVYCWGSNYREILNYSDNIDSENPVFIDLPTNRTAIQVSIGSSHACTILDNNSYYCWAGYDGPSYPDLRGGRYPLKIASGNQYSSGNPEIRDFIILDDGSLYCRGNCNNIWSHSIWQYSVYGFRGSSSTFQIQCPTGTFQNLTGQDNCKETTPGHYTHSGASEQIPCSPGTWQNEHGQSSCMDAIPGHFVYGYGNTNETECELGTWQDLVAQASCKDADPGHYVNSTGSSSQDPCPMGAWNNITGQSACLEASPGRFAYGYGNTNETECELGTWQDLVAQTSCKDADPGHYVNSTGSSSQNPCSPGTWQDLVAQESCKDANPGHYVSANASSIQEPCEPGRYQPGIGQTSCIEADIGFYVPQNGLGYQTKCMWNETTIARGSIICIEDTDGDGSANVVDEDDDGDKVKDIDDFCPQGDTNWTSGAALGTDLDGDGCRDEGEDNDDDNDGIEDQNDLCPRGHTGWMSNPLNDLDGDGCHVIEDFDIDGDGFNNVDDLFPDDPTEWNDSDGDGIGDNVDAFPNDSSRWVVDDKDPIESDDDNYITVILGATILVLIIALLAVLKKK